MTIPKLEPSKDGVYVGGSVNALLSLISRISPEDAGVELVACMPASKLPFFAQNKPVEIHCSIFSNNRKPQSLQFALTYLAKACLWAMYNARGEVDLVHGHSGYAAYAWVTYLLCKIVRCPGLQTVYCPLTKGTGLKGLFLNTVIARYPLNRMDSIIAMSQNISDSLVAAGVDKNKIRIIPNGIDTERYKPDNNVQIRIRDLLGIEKDTKIILFVGNLSESKGLDVLFEAMPYIVARDKKSRLVVTLELEHEGFKERWQKLIARARTLGFERYIVRLGIIDFMLQLMAASDLVVAPYRNTIGPSDYPLAIMEAMSVGTCVVGTEVGGIPELIEDGVTGRLVKSEDVHGLAEVLSELLKTPEICKQMGKKARRRVKDLYSIDKVAERHLNFYKQIIKDTI